MDPLSSPLVEHPGLSTPIRPPARDAQFTPSRSVTRESDLREKLEALKYELVQQKEERERERLHHESIVSRLELKVKEEGRRVDSLQSDQVFLFSKNKDSADALATLREEQALAKAQLENTCSLLRSQLLEANERLEQSQSATRSEMSRLQQTIDDLSLRNSNSKVTIEELTAEVSSVTAALGEKQRALVDQEELVARLQASALNAQLNQTDIDSIEMMKRETAELISHCRDLESKVAQKDHKIDTLVQERKLIDIVEEEKTTLQAKVRMIPGLQQQVSDLELKVIDLENSRNRWSSFLEKDDSFSTPEDIVRALVHLRIENVSLRDRIGNLDAQLSSTSSEAYEREIQDLKDRLQDTKDKLDKEVTQRMRAENQRELSVKESQLLRDQLRAYDSEDAVLNNKAVDESRAARIAELEGLVDKYKSQTETLSKQLSEKEGLVVTLNSPLRRPRPSSDDSSERLAESHRKIRNLQTDIDKHEVTISGLNKEIQALQQQLEHAQQSSTTKQRILELRTNPTTRVEVIKMETLRTLKKENDDLLAQLQAKLTSTDMVPLSTLERAKNDTKELERTISELNKRMERLKEVFSKKSLEFREAVYSLLGFRLDLLPNRKVRATSKYASDSDSLTFIPDPKAKYKFIGIEENAWAAEFDNLVTFYIKERQDIPSFLSAVNLELFERTTKAARF